MTEAEVEKLRSAGIDDAVILGLQKDEAVKNGQAAPVVQSNSALPEVDPNTPSTVFEQAQAAGVPTAGREQTWGQTAVELGRLAADHGGKIATVLGGGLVGFGANQLRKGMQAGAAATQSTAAATQATAAAQQATANAAMEQARAAQMQAQGVQNRFDARATQQAAARAGAVAPSPILDSSGRPMQMQPRPMPPAPAPAAPAYMPPAAPAPAAPAPSVIQRGTDIANQMRQYAAQRVIPAVSQAGQMVGRGLTAAAPALRVGGMASNALYSGGLNTDEQAELERRRKMAPTISR